ncbi:hypothetical protein F5Y03DRAFT_58266 [Xylaria venustula]|nr:hypothetical protein F5Y03DRAFT_58266 [Xylaria venustula]
MFMIDHPSYTPPLSLLGILVSLLFLASRNLDFSFLLSLPPTNTQTHKHIHIHTNPSPRDTQSPRFLSEQLQLDGTSTGPRPGLRFSAESTFPLFGHCLSTKELQFHSIVWYLCHESLDQAQRK